MTATTKTGDFGIGFRTMGGAGWCKDVAGMAAWAGENGFACVDVGADVAAARAVLDAGLKVGSMDLPTKNLIHRDADTRKREAAACGDLVREAVGLGVRTFFVVLKPVEPERPRAENLELTVDAYRLLAAAVEGCGARFAIEGWPGPGVTGCTPETLRAVLGGVDSAAMAVNYDPSHLVRMGIDPLRFLAEFASRVAHVHAKDCDVDAERQYLYGHEQPPTFPEKRGFAGPTWRYCLPGHGSTRWTSIMELLVDAGYDGLISIEMEDARFNATEADQKEAVLLSRRYLEGV